MSVSFLSFPATPNKNGKNRQKNSIENILMNQITIMVWLVIQSQTFWNVKLSGL